MNLRISKIIVTASLGLYMAIVVFNNVNDYGSNFEFVKHVLSMDDTFPGNSGMWRAITGSGFHHFFYVSIILTELIISGLCLLGAISMWKSRNTPENRFQAMSKYALMGLTLGFVLWFVGFLTIGGEWFLMWQSTTWNGSEVAMRNSLLFGIVLTWITRKEGY